MCCWSFIIIPFAGTSLCARASERERAAVKTMMIERMRGAIAGGGGGGGGVVLLMVGVVLLVVVIHDTGCLLRVEALTLVKLSPETAIFLVQQVVRYPGLAMHVICFFQGPILHSVMSVSNTWVETRRTTDKPHLNKQTRTWDKSPKLNVSNGVFLVTFPPEVSRSCTWRIDCKGPIASVFAENPNLAERVKLKKDAKSFQTSQTIVPPYSRRALHPVDGLVTLTFNTDGTMTIAQRTIDRILQSTREEDFKENTNFYDILTSTIAENGHKYREDDKNMVGLHLLLENAAILHAAPIPHDHLATTSSQVTPHDYQTPVEPSKAKLWSADLYYYQYYDYLLSVRQAKVHSPNAANFQLNFR